MKPRVGIFVTCFVAGGLADSSTYRSIARDEVHFLDTQKQPLLMQDVTKRLGHTEVGKGPYYVYVLKEPEATVEFWMLPAPKIVPPKGIGAEIGMVVERSSVGTAVIIWPAALKGRDVEVEKRRLYPKMYPVR